MIATKKITQLLVVILSLLTLACSNYEPKEINYGQDICAYCKMNIVQAPFASQMITAKGKVLLFDSIECLAAISLTEPQNYSDAHSLWVADFETPGEYLPYSHAVYLYGGAIKSPMGVRLLAVNENTNIKTELIEKFGAVEISWPDLRDTVKSEWGL